MEQRCCTPPPQSGDATKPASTRDQRVDFKTPVSSSPRRCCSPASLCVSFTTSSSSAVLLLSVGDSVEAETSRKVRSANKTVCADTAGRELRDPHRPDAFVMGDAPTTITLTQAQLDLWKGNSSRPRDAKEPPRSHTGSESGALLSNHALVLQWLDATNDTDLHTVQDATATTAPRAHADVILLNERGVSSGAGGRPVAADGDVPPATSVLTSSTNAIARVQLPWATPPHSVSPVRTPPSTPPPQHASLSSSPVHSRSCVHEAASAYTAPVHRQQRASGPVLLPSPSSLSPPSLTLFSCPRPALRKKSADVASASEDATSQRPTVQLFRASPLSSFYAASRSSITTQPQTLPRQSGVKQDRVKAVVDGMTNARDRIRRSTPGGARRSTSPSSSSVTEASDTAFSLRICTLSGFTINVAVDRRMRVSQLVDSVASYLHVGRALVQLKYAKTGTIFASCDASPASAAAAVSQMPSTRLCDVPQLEPGDVFVVLLQPQKAAVQATSHRSSPTRHAASPERPTAARTPQRKRRRSPSSATRSDQYHADVASASLVRASQPPRTESRRSRSVVSSLPSLGVSPSRPSASAARGSGVRGDGGKDGDDDDGARKDRSGVCGGVLLSPSREGKRGEAPSTTPRKGLERLIGSYGFPPLAGTPRQSQQ